MGAANAMYAYALAHHSSNTGSASRFRVGSHVAKESKLQRKVGKSVYYLSVLRWYYSVFRDRRPWNCGAYSCSRYH